MNYLIEQSITLDIGSKYCDKLWFRDSVKAEEHWVQINRVFLLNIWEDMGKCFDNPKIQEQMTPEQITQTKSDFEKQFLEVCPKGMCMPIIEYECEDDIFLQFYYKDHLDSTPVHRNSSVGFIIHPDEPIGILGLKLKASVIQGPVHADITSIKVERFQFCNITTGEDIVLK